MDLLSPYQQQLDIRFTMDSVRSIQKMRGKIETIWAYLPTTHPDDAPSRTKATCRQRHALVAPLITHLESDPELCSSTSTDLLCDLQHLQVLLARYHHISS